MRITFPLLVVSLSLFLDACVTTSSSPEFRESRVVERMGRSKETPQWVDGANPMFEEGPDVMFATVLTMSGDARPEACLKAADMDSRSMMLRYIKDTLTASGQLNEVSASSDPGYESLIAFLSQGSIKGARTTQRYWEKVEESDAAGARVLRVKCAVKLSIKKSELARQMRDSSDNPAGNTEIRKKLLEAQGAFIESLGSSGSEK
jgi:hypothetical protein